MCIYIKGIPVACTHSGSLWCSGTGISLNHCHTPEQDEFEISHDRASNVLVYQ